MRVERLEFTGIGPFRRTQAIDFTKLSDSGLFLIDGPTGAGKTTIIDAIVFALFGTLSGEDSSKERIRSDHALDSEKSEVILDFSVQGRKHRITRSPSYQVEKANGQGFTEKAAKQSLVEFDVDGSVKETYTHVKDIGVHVSQLLNMKAKEFRQLVVLAQGEFAALLRMNPRERLDSLRGLLGTKFFQDLQALVAAEGTKSKEALSEAREVLDQIVTRAEAYLDDNNRESLVPAFEVLHDQSSTTEQRLSAIASIHDSFKNVSEDCVNQLGIKRKDLDPIEEEYSKLSVMMAHLGSIEEASLALSTAEAALDQADASIDARDAAIRSDELKIQAGALQPLAEWEVGESQRNVERHDLEIQVENADSRRAQFENELAEIPKVLTQLENLMSNRDQLIRALEDSRSRLTEVDALLVLIDQLEVARQSDAVAEEHEKTATRNLNVVKVELERAQLLVTTLLKQQLEQRIAVLAQGLVDGEPCRVCGSTEHPAPAHADVPAAVVTDSDVTEAKEKVDSLSAKFVSVSKLAEQAIARRNESALSVAECLGKVGENSAEQLAHEKSHLTKTVNDLAVEVESLSTVESDIASKKQELEESTEMLELLVNESREAWQKLEYFDKSVSEFQEKIHKAVGESSTAVAKRKHLLERAARLTTLNSAHEMLMERQRTLTFEMSDTEQIRNRCETLGEERAQLLSVVQDLVSQEAIAKERLNSITRLKAEYESTLKENAILEKQHGDVIRLAEIVTAQSPQNVKKLPLESYALQLRFSHVLEAASHHFEHMSSGRLSFVLSQERQANAQTGLGIEIMDSWTGEARSPASLSGGETFYASLSLALGLADVVQAEAGGVSLETLFVDEGFGSLDQETLQVVLDQLEELKSGGRVIGVISHVSEMKDRFPERLVVQPQTDGTSIVLTENAI